MSGKRQKSESDLQWAKARDAFEVIDGASGIDEYFDALDSLKANFGSKPAQSYLKYCQHYTREGLRLKIEGKLQAEMLEKWEVSLACLKAGDWQILGYSYGELTDCLADNWEQVRQWRIPPRVEKARELLSAAGVAIDDNFVRSWNRMTVEVNVRPKIGSFIGMSPTERVSTVVARAAEIVAAERRRAWQDSGLGGDRVDAAIVVAYCDFRDKYRNAVGAERLALIEDLARRAD